MSRWLLLFFLLPLTTCETDRLLGLHDVKWNDCDVDHFGTPLVRQMDAVYIGMEILFTEASRYILPHCNCEETDLGDWNKLGGAASIGTAQKNSVLLGWRYIDGAHFLAPYIHDNDKGNEINPDFCQADKIIEVQEYQSYFFLARSIGGTLDYVLLDRYDNVLFSDTLPPDKEFICHGSSRYGRFVWANLRAAEAYFGGQCRPPETHFYRRMLSKEEVKNLFP